MDLLNQARAYLNSLDADSKVARVVAGVAFLISILITGIMPRESFLTLIVSYGIAFCIYLFVLNKSQRWKWWLGVGLAARFMLVFAFPNLSDDLYRFFWDGSLTMSGISPFAWTPESLIHSPSTLPDGLEVIFPLLNSQSYYTVYPIVCQLFFFLGSLFSGGNVETFSIALKLIFLACECGSLCLLYLMLRDIGKTRTLVIYALNPLVLIELIGNLHFEAVMILLILGVLRLLQHTRIVAGAMLLASAIGTKLLPLIFIPFLWRRMDFRRAILFTSVVALVCAVLFVPILAWSDGTGFIASLDLYFRKFEFNASFYYVMRWLGNLYYEYNPIALIGPLAAMIGGLVILFLAFRERSGKPEHLPHILVLAVSVYFFFTTTVHPWYLCTLVALAALTTLSYPIIWSGVAFLSYAAYRDGSAGEVLWLIALEYLIIAIWILRDWPEIRKVMK